MAKYHSNYYSFRVVFGEIVVILLCSYSQHLIAMDVTPRGLYFNLSLNIDIRVSVQIRQFCAASSGPVRLVLLPAALK
jgi:hypothetical protein